MKIIQTLLLAVLITCSFVSNAQQTDTLLSRPIAIGTDGSSSEDQIFQKIEIDARFDGGLTAWTQFLNKHLRSKIPARKGAPVGHYTVMAQFIVNKDGTISDIKTLTNHGYGMEKEVIRVMKKSPKWLPAQQNGRKMRAYIKQPITFVISHETP